MLRKIFFIIPALSGGGAQRVIIQLLKYLDRRRFSPCLVLFEEKGPFVKDLPSDVKLYAFSKSTYIYGLQWLFVLIKLSSLIKKERPEVVVSFLWYTNAISLLAKILFRIKCKVIVSERNTLSLSFEGWLTNILRKISVGYLYQQADSIIVITKKMGQELVNLFDIQANKIVSIYNPIDIAKVLQDSKAEVEYLWFSEKIPVITSIGSLTRKKGFPYLLKALAVVNRNGLLCRLVILGEGPERTNLLKLAENLRIDSTVAFLGFQDNPYKYLAKSTIFVLSSLHEGFPNVLLEALALGIPSIATRCPTGPEEIITESIDGILVPPADELALADAIKKLLLDEGLRKRLGKSGKKRAEDFNVEKIVRQYEQVIEDVCRASVAD